MQNNTHTPDGRITAYGFNLGYIENTFGTLRTVTLARTGAGCDYVVTVQNGITPRLVARANFARLSDARKYARAVLADLTTTPSGGVSTL